MIEMPLRKRKALPGEVGLFPVDPGTEEDFSALPMNSDVWAELSNSRNMALLRLMWALATMLARGGLYDDKNDAMDDLKRRTRFARFSYENGIVYIVPKSLKKVSGVEMNRLADRMFHVVATDLLPHMKVEAIRAEAERMISGARD